MFRRHLFLITLVLAILLIAARGVTAGTYSAGIPPLPIVGEIGENAQAVDVAGDYAYVGFGNEFAVVDVADKENPVQVGSLMMPETFRWVQVRDKLAYLALENGLTVVDISQPTAPYIRDTFSETNVTHLEVQEPYAYLLAQTYLIIVDVKNPDNVFEAGRHQFAEPITFWFTDLALNIPYVFATRMGGPTPGTWVVNISDPANPIEIVQWPSIDGPITAIKDNIFYNAYGNCHVYCPAVFVSFDISDLMNPVKVNIVQNGDGFIRDMELEGGYAYTGSRIQLQIFALSLTGDAFLGHSFAAQEIQDVAIKDDYIYLAAEPGLQIVLGPPYNPVHLPILTLQQ